MTYYVIVHYSAGRAGAGWPTSQSRTVRIPHVTQEAAQVTYDRALSGAGGCSSSLPAGVIPDRVSLCEETPVTRWERSR